MTAPRGSPYLSSASANLPRASLEPTGADLPPRAPATRPPRPRRGGTGPTPPSRRTRASREPTPPDRVLLTGGADGDDDSASGASGASASGSGAASPRAGPGSGPGSAATPRAALGGLAPVPRPLRRAESGPRPEEVGPAGLPTHPSRTHERAWLLLGPGVGRDTGPSAHTPPGRWRPPELAGRARSPEPPPS